MADNKRFLETELPGLKLIVLFLAILSVAASFNPRWGLWGLDSSAVFTTWSRIGLLLVVTVSIIPAVARRLDREFDRILTSATASKFSVGYLIFSIAMIVLFVLLSSHNHIQGDGYNVMGHLIGGYVFSPTEPLDYLLHFAVARAIGGTEAAVLQSYQACSYFAGALFLAAVFFLFRRHRDISVAITLAGASGVTLFFFGYTESYTFRFLFMFIYAVTATRDWMERRVSWSSGLFLVLAVGFHLSSMVMIPSFAFLIWNKYRTKKATWITIVVTILIVAAAIADLLMFAPIRLLQIAVPLSPTANNPYFLFSADHLFDILNAILLTSPLIILLGVIAYRDRSYNIWWAAWTIGPALLFTIIIDPKIGAFRDWDLLSITAAPVMASLIFVFVRLRHGLYGLLVTIALFALLHTGGWILWNTDGAGSYAKIRDIVHHDKHYSREYYQGYNNKAWSLIVGRFIEDRNEVVRACEERFAGEPGDTLNVCNLTYAYLYAGDTLSAIRIARENWRRFSGDAGTVSALGSLMYTLKYFSESATMYESYIAGGGNDYRLYRDLAIIMEVMGRIDTAMVLYDRSLVLWPDPPISSELAFYSKASGMGYRDIAMSGLRRIAPRVPDRLKPTVASLIDALTANDRGRIDTLARSLMFTGG